MIPILLQQQIIQSLVEKIHPQQVFLFGSYAEGQPTADSDLDLMIVLDNPSVQKLRHHYISQARQALSHIRLPKDILVYHRDEIEKWKDSINHVVYHCLTRGQKLYEQS